MDHLLFVGAEYSEHGRLFADDQLPEATFLRVVAALDPAALVQHGEELLDIFTEPLVDRAPFEAAVVGVDELTDRGLLLEDALHLAIEVEVADHRDGAGAQVVEPIAIAHAAIELGAVAHLRPGIQQALHSLLRVAVVGVVDGDVQGEVVRVDAQLGQLVGRDQQVQRQLLVTEVEADDFRQELLGVLGQRQLDGALDEVFVVQLLPVVAALAGQQLAVEHHVVLLRLPFAEFLQVGLDQRGETRIVPALQQAVEPGAVDQLGRRHAAQEMQRMGLAREIAARATGAALLEISLVLTADRFGALQHPGVQTGGVRRQVAGQGGGRFELRAQVIGGVLPRVLVDLADEGEVQRP